MSRRKSNQLAASKAPAPLVTRRRMEAAPTAKVQATQLKFVVEDERRVPRKRRDRIPKGAQTIIALYKQ